MEHRRVADLHIRSNVIPLPWNVFFAQIDLVRYFCCHCCSFRRPLDYWSFRRFIYGLVFGERVTKKPLSPTTFLLGQELGTPAVPPGLVFITPTHACHHMQAFDHGKPLPSHLLDVRLAYIVWLALGRPFVADPVPLFHYRRLSGTFNSEYYSPSTVWLSIMHLWIRFVKENRRNFNKNEIALDYQTIDWYIGINQSFGSYLDDKPLRTHRKD